MKKLWLIAGGLFTGIINGLFGAGGGMLLVPILDKNGLNAKESHATSVFTILPMTVLSASLYLFRGNVSFKDSLFYLPFGLLGAVLGARFLKKIPEKYLRLIFSLFILYASVRMMTA